MEPIVEFLSRFDDRLPDWLVRNKRWIGILALGAITGLIALFILSIYAHVMPNSWLTKLLGR